MPTSTREVYVNHFWQFVPNRGRATYAFLPLTRLFPTNDSTTATFQQQTLSVDVLCQIDRHASANRQDPTQVPAFSIVALEPGQFFRSQFCFFVQDGCASFILCDYVVQVLFGCFGIGFGTHFQCMALPHICRENGCRCREMVLEPYISWPFRNELSR